jgi:hypothetical protein
MTDDLAKQLRADAEAYRQSLAAPTSHDMFTLAYQWQDKKHRHVWDLCSKIETAADRIEKLEAALREIAQTVTIEDESWHPSYHDPRFTQKQAEGLAEALSARIKISRKALEGKDGA